MKPAAWSSRRRLPRFFAERRLTSSFMALSVGGALLQLGPATRQRDAVRLGSNRAQELTPRPQSLRLKPCRRVERCSAPLRVPAAALEDGGSAAVTFAAASGGALAALAAALTLADPERRRQKQAAEVGGVEKDAVRKYFNTAGFSRWKRIYGETDDVNSVQKDIREGHAITVSKVLSWLKEEGPLEGITVCDAGCGTGSLSLPLALEGAKVYASDISSAMVGEAQARADEAFSKSGNPKAVPPVFETSDLESVTGRYHTVACLDVLIHYPQQQSDDMIGHLASLAEDRVILSFAPYTPYYAVLKRIGELFPGPSKATRAYLHAEEEVENALKKAGWKVVKREMTATRFYFSRLLEAVPISS